MGCTKVHLLRHRRVDPGIDPDQLFAGRARDSLMRTEDAKSNRAPMRSPIGQLNEDHRNFSRLLDVLESQLETAPGTKWRDKPRCGEEKNRKKRPPVRGRGFADRLPLPCPPSCPHSVGKRLRFLAS